MLKMHIYAEIEWGKDSAFILDTDVEFATLDANKLFKSKWADILSLIVDWAPDRKKSVIEGFVAKASKMLDDNEIGKNDIKRCERWCNEKDERYYVSCYASKCLDFSVSVSIDWWDE